MLKNTPTFYDALNISVTLNMFRNAKHVRDAKHARPSFSFLPKIDMADKTTTDDRRRTTTNDDE